MKYLLAISALLVGSTGLAQAADPPNMIFVLSDDVAQGDLGCYGQQIIQTPHLDRTGAGRDTLPAGLLWYQRMCPQPLVADYRPALRALPHTR